LGKGNVAVIEPRNVSLTFVLYFGVKFDFYLSLILSTSGNPETLQNVKTFPFCLISSFFNFVPILISDSLLSTLLDDGWRWPEEVLKFRKTDVSSNLDQKECNFIF
jgi:hypothetical protein